MDEDRDVTAVFTLTSAPTTGTFAGKIVQTTYTGGLDLNAPVANAQITFKNLSTSVVSAPILSLSDGTYLSPSLGAGNYQIVITRADVKAVTVTKPLIVLGAATHLPTFGVIVTPLAGETGFATVEVTVQNNTAAAVTAMGVVVYAGYCLEVCEPSQKVDSIAVTPASFDQDGSVDSISAGASITLPYHPQANWGVLTIVPKGIGFAQVTPYVLVVDNPFGAGDDYTSPNNDAPFATRIQLNR